MLQHDVDATAAPALQRKGNARVQTVDSMPDGLRRMMDLSISGSDMGLETF